MKKQWRVFLNHVGYNPKIEQIEIAFLNVRRSHCFTFIFNGIADHFVDCNRSLGFALDHAKELAKYVADVEMQKLDRLIANLGNVYTVYHDWGNAIQAQILQIEGTQHQMIMIVFLSGGCAVSMILPCNSVILMNILLLMFLQLLQHQIKIFLMMKN
jgi:hypothetical protein